MVAAIYTLLTIGGWVEDYFKVLALKGSSRVARAGNPLKMYG